jgi:hypothetical protein
MMALPACFFFGFDELGRGCVLGQNLLYRSNGLSYSLIMVLATGIYCTSVAKDLFCSPRPFSPPVTRLSKIFESMYAFFTF